LQWLKKIERRTWQTENAGVLPLMVGLELVHGDMRHYVANGTNSREPKSTAAIIDAALKPKKADSVLGSDDRSSCGVNKMCAVM
jgi:hypothetical protein